MSNDNDRHSPSETCTPSDLKASDFFPPGTGWNKSPAPATPKSEEELDAEHTRADIGQV